jgi:hypothetical protein
MRHTYVTLIICIAASIGLGFAQSIQADTLKALATKWESPDGALHCLTALKLYTADPVANAEAALKELTAGAPSHEDLYRVAQDQADFLNWLVTACSEQNPDSTIAKGCKEKNPDPTLADALFDGAKKLIDGIYAVDSYKKDLAEVHKSSSSKSYYLALSQLLNIYRKQTLSDEDLRGMERLRLCYRLNRDRLFKLVDDKISPTS